MKSDAEKTLSSYVDALYPIIYINHFDFHVIDTLLGEIANGRKITEFNHGIGFVDFATKSAGRRCELEDFLDDVKDDGYDHPTFIVLKDVHKQLDEPKVMSLLKYIASRNLYIEEYNATVFIVASRLSIPKELADLITVFDIPLPSDSEIGSIVDDFAKTLDIEVNPDTRSELCLSLKGLNEFQIQQILNLAFQDGGTLDKEDKELILSQKEQLIKKAGLLEMVNFSESIEDIGGLENLKHWLYRKERIFNQLDKAIEFGVDVPKGILIVGMPGCGKSLAAKATAKLFQIPLVRLDVGRLLGKYVGESEENMRDALKLSEAISPCVLWVDEIEKAFAGVGSSNEGNDVTTRLFGQFLTWMQEKENTVFIVATANNISSLPPEFLRKGRFDELFYVDLPNYEERRKIIEIHLKKRLEKRHKLDHSININSIARDTEGYSGADLEAIVKDAIETCFIENSRPLTTKDLADAKSSIKSISVTLEKQIKKIQDAVKDMDLKSASSEQQEDLGKSTIHDAQESPHQLECTDLTLLSILGHRWWKEPLLPQNEDTQPSNPEAKSPPQQDTPDSSSSFLFKVSIAYMLENRCILARGKVIQGSIHVGDWCTYPGSCNSARVEKIEHNINQSPGTKGEVEVLLQGSFSPGALNGKTLQGCRSMSKENGNNVPPSTEFSEKAADLARVLKATADKKSFSFFVISAKSLGNNLYRATIKVASGTVRTMEKCSMLANSRAAIVYQIGFGFSQRQELKSGETEDIVLKGTLPPDYQLKGEVFESL